MFMMIKTFSIASYVLFFATLFAQEIPISNMYAVNCSSEDTVIRRIYIEFNNPSESTNIHCYADIQILDTESGKEWKQTVMFDKVSRRNAHSSHIMMYTDINIPTPIKSKKIKPLVIPKKGYCSYINAKEKYALSAKRIEKQNKIELITNKRGAK